MTGNLAPTQKATWTKRTIDAMLRSEKHTGDLHLLNDEKCDFYYKAEEINPAMNSIKIKINTIFLFIICFLHPI